MLMIAKRNYWRLRAALKKPPAVLFEAVGFHIANCFRGENVRKRANELRFWRQLQTASGNIYNGHYAYFYTEHFGLSLDSYAGKAILDIGCGPGGSLVWANTAKSRVGLDPLALEYKSLGRAGHSMSYFAARSEEIPFCDNAFDVVASFNSLDHVDDLKCTINEIVRVLKPGGVFLLITDVNHPPTACEPHRVSLEIIETLASILVRVEQRHFEAAVPDNIYGSILKSVTFDGLKFPARSGILSAKFIKPMQTRDSAVLQAK
jgi:SAM-dependent methyltransferase